MSLGQRRRLYAFPDLRRATVRLRSQEHHFAQNVSTVHPTVAASAAGAAAQGLPWRLADIDFSRLEPDRVRDDDTLYFVLATSALVEAATHHYASNLIEYYAGDAELAAWLRAHWQPEELQHGAALRAYVEA